MIHGFIKVAAVTPEVRVADPVFNADEIIKEIRALEKEHVKIIVFPELALTGATCGDLFLQGHLIEEAKVQLRRICEETEESEALIVIGLPVEVHGKLYNAAAVLQEGELLGLVPKMTLEDHEGASEHRYFAEGYNEVDYVAWGGSVEEDTDDDDDEDFDPDDDIDDDFDPDDDADEDDEGIVIFIDDDDDDDDDDDEGFAFGDEDVSFGTEILFTCEEIPHLVVAVEIGSDLGAVLSPGDSHAAAGATILCVPSATSASVGRERFRRSLVEMRSATGICGMIIAEAGEGESTTDQVFDGRSVIAENGEILAEAYRSNVLISEIDVDRLAHERRRNSSFPDTEAYADEEEYDEVPFDLAPEKTALTRTFAPHPFVPEDKAECTRRCQEILAIQAYGLKKRLTHTRTEKVVIGISGGLDSTLALLVCARTMDLLGLPRENIIAVTMPGFGTTDRTYTNACTLIETTGASFREIPIRDAVTVHFKDIGQDPDNHDTTYENAQARERTQILMDIANQIGGMVVGTGDLSELALGWATYNGDHMSMYGVNGSIPKTLLRSLVRHAADTCGDDALSKALLDVLDTPVSPELLPPENGTISQKTEELVGPYELHDFFLYYMLRAGFEPAKIFRVARQAFAGTYNDQTILQWLKVFYKRFFSQQYKRSCLPDGPKVGSVSLSPRGGLRMPSDASAEIWLAQLEKDPD